MFSYAGGLVLFAALLHASWNAMLHGNRDRVLSMAWMSLAIAAVSSVAVIVLPMPARQAWPYFIASGVVHVVYNAALVRAYRHGGLAQSYPIARGSSPLLVTLGAACFAHEAPGPMQVLGVVLISAGIIALAPRGGTTSRAAVVTALATGAIIAIYTVIDGMGVRQSGGQAWAYTMWTFTFYWLTLALFVATRGFSALWVPLRTQPMALVSSLGGGLVSIAAYGIVIWAMQSSAMGEVSALRETSVVFAALIGRIFLREKVGAGRLLACVVIATGAICLGL